MKAKEFIPQSKPRNFVAKNQKTAGAGAHKDKKRAEKQGDVKHKGKQYDEGVSEGEATLSKIAAAGDDGYDMIDDGLNGLLGGEAEIMLQDMYNEISIEYRLHPDDDFEKIIDRMMDRIENDYGNNMSERFRDPEDWDEGNTEPPNNFAVYINGKKWKVFQGRGTYADDAREMAQYYKLQDWARKKTQDTGKKWEVSRTGEPATESIKEDTNIPFNQCPHCSGPIFHESLMNEKQDACYHKVRSRYKVWPSAYASGALVQCRKKGAKNWGNKGKK